MDYFRISVNVVEKNRISGNKHKSIRKSRNKIIKILIKLKCQNLPKSRFEYLSKY